MEAGVNQEEIFYKIAKKFSMNVILDKDIKEKIEKRLTREAGKNRPQIVLESSIFDFGQVDKKQGKLSKTFKLPNRGDVPLIITNMKTLCPCVSVSLKVEKNKSPYFGTEGAPKNWQAVIAVAQTAEIELLIDLASSHIKPGKLIREASIISNDPIYPEVTVRIEAEIEE